MLRREDVLYEALALPDADRAYVAEMLDRSLANRPVRNETPRDGKIATGAGDELITELQRRSAAYREGSTTGRPAADVLADLRRRQTGDTAS